MKRLEHPHERNCFVFNSSLTEDDCALHLQKCSPRTDRQKFPVSLTVHFVKMKRKKQHPSFIAEKKKKKKTTGKVNPLTGG